MTRYLNSPYRTKYKYYHFRMAEKGQKGIAFANKKNVILKVKTKKPMLLTPAQLEVIRRMFAKKVKVSNGLLSFRCFPDLPLAKKPLGARMGKGKGKFSAWKAPIKNGQVLVEFTPRRRKFVKGAYVKKKLGDVKRKRGKWRLVNKPFVSVLRKINKKVNYRMPVDTKIVCRFKKPQQFRGLWYQEDCDDEIGNFYRYKK
jgi:large subunit ribosomal protein L16